MVSEKKFIHVGIIPDGNRRWALEKKFSYGDVIDYHYLYLRNLLLAIREGNLEYFKNSFNTKEFSIFLLSKNNIEKRKDSSVAEVYRSLELLKELFLEYDDLKEIITFSFVGELHLLPQATIKIIEYLEDLTKNGSTLITMAIAYDPIEDSKKLLSEGYSRKQSDIDLVIRTGKVVRTSGFFPLKTLDSEWCFPNIYFPDFTLKDYEKALEDFFDTERRFGG